MGCHSGKAAVPQSSTNATSQASPDLTLLAAATPEKEPSTPEKDPSTPEKNKAAGSWMVIDSGKLFGTYEGIARALDVYHSGWVPEFKDVRNGDTGTLLSEVTAPADAVALRLHRNGAIVCIARKGVEVAGFNGTWSSGDIKDDKLTWSDGTVTTIRIDEMTRKMSLTYEGHQYTAEFADDKIMWSDGDVWSRERESKKDVPAGGNPARWSMDASGRWESTEAAGSHQEAGLPGSDSPAEAEVSRLSTVSEEPASSASSPDYPNEIQSPSKIQYPIKEAGATVGAPKAVEAEPLSSQRALFGSAAAATELMAGAGGIEKKGRREKNMCCC